MHWHNSGGIMSKKYLLLCGYYNDKTNANSVCQRNIADELTRSGNSVTVLTYDDDDSNCGNVYSVKLDYLRRTIAKLQAINTSFARISLFFFQNVRRLIVGPFFPSTPSLAAKRYYKKAKELIEQNNIEAVISFYKPYDSVKCGLRLKRDFGEKIKYVSYHLDLLTIPENGDNQIGQYKRRKSLKAFNEELERTDLILLPASMQDVYENEKIEFVDFPLYITENYNASNVAFDNSVVNLTYIGTLDENNRTPNYFVEILHSYNKRFDKKVRLHIWGKMPERFQENDDTIQYHGMLDNSQVFDVLSKSDYIVNFSNKVTYQWVPSKIFQLFSTGKPIIDIVSNISDVSISYFERYGNVVFINEFEGSPEKDIESLRAFLSRNTDDIVCIDKDAFLKAKPEYHAKIIEGIFNEE